MRRWVTKLENSINQFEKEELGIIEKQLTKLDIDSSSQNLKYLKQHANALNVPSFKEMCNQLEYDSILGATQ